MPPVKSSMMTWVDYDPARRTLTVTFTSGRIYVYANVPAKVYATLLEAPSLGRYFDEYIRDRYPYAQAR